ncbi:CoA pyrophosphatase [Clostridium sp. HMP27]|uniref:NUDIX hydrolase n=1 Tax=Clostridium sp. HMP27 TaxID=1487921 RepID=UPI00052DD51D|nr:CoA pyrophosphatase [Clostridium sp. HMP27]KGK87548.1 hydrolase [Clostridium sp. HMP27]
MISNIESIFKNRQADLIGNYNKYAVMICITEEEAPSIVFEIRALTLTSQPGDVSLPGGKIEPGESPMEAAIRETMEELNIGKEDIKVIGAMDYFVSPYNQVIYPFVGILKKCDFQWSKDEVHKIFKVPVDFFLSNEPEKYDIDLIPEFPDNFPYHLIVGGKNYKFSKGKREQYFYKYNEYVIWGFTALIIKRFIDIIR